MAKYSDLSDGELTSLLKEGDREAFTAIYDRYFRLLHTHAYKWLRNREETRDVIHEIFLRLWEKREFLSLEHGLPGYLYTSVRNMIFNLLSRKRIESEYLISLGGFINQGECMTDHLVRERQLVEMIEYELASMPPKMRKVFQLSRKENLSHKEISETLDISEQTVRKHIQHALKILRFRLGLYLLFYFLTRL
ncbi:RNA polymerase sigma factor [Parapedobacter tibetensis]|uniref:RNA polymerase sigma factor n=1 Tax=Parapedobacter tibetensis TaxID=2972951 RepID=UPI00214DA001|nr:RNA polymerase sigma-70 factor [Parapedobacter tibetensis]